MQEIYSSNEYIIYMLEKTVYELRRQNFDLAVRAFAEAGTCLNANIGNIIKESDYFNELSVTVDTDYIMNVLKEVTKAQKVRDYILLADLIELQLISLVREWQNVIITKSGAFYIKDNYEQNLKYLKDYDEALYRLVNEDSINENEYIVEPTVSGRATVKVIKNTDEFYIEGNNDPAYDAYLFADRYYTTEKYKYIMFGLGLCYKTNELIARDIEEIRVYESDLNIIKLACRYGDLSQLSTGVFKLFYDSDCSKYSNALKCIDSDTELIMDYSAIKNLRNESVMARFEQLYLVDSSIRNQRGIMNSNFRSNIIYCSKNADELQPIFEGKDVYIIAAGPSLDKNIDKLLSKPENSMILAVGTVYRKLMSMGIAVDYVVISDANRRIIGQISGLEENDVPLILLSTAYKGFAKIYKGERYIAFQEDFDKSKDYADMHGYNTYKAGGSVATVALDLSIRLGAGRIIFLGLDLAYTNNLAHAEGTSRREHKGTEGLIKVKSVDNGEVYANNSFILVREWIERRIDKESNIEIIDATEGGALIRGTIIRSLNEVLYKRI